MQGYESFLPFKKRRQRLLQKIKEQFPEVAKHAVVMVGAFEGERLGFRQDSSFYYFTGITEPAAVWLMLPDGSDHLYLPNFGKEREKWVNVKLSLESNPAAICFDKICGLSNQISGYSYGRKFHHDLYRHLLSDIENLIEDGVTFFAELHTHTDAFDQDTFFKAFQSCIKTFSQSLCNASSIMHELRRIKDQDEILFLEKAIAVTIEAQERAAKVIKPGVSEFEVQASIEYIFMSRAGATPSFPSIVAAGRNSTVLHYVDRNALINQGDLVVVDIGAEYGFYAADLTRTYPASGVFSTRQREVYQMVLDAQMYIASIAKPGMYLRNPEKKDLCLHSNAVEFFKKRGYAQYFPHGIGHYLGLDVHDVGDYTTPLQIGDVFTIEPGLYIPQESLGVRIEDDYLMQKDGAVCLSANLPKTIESIEAMMK